MVMAMVMVVMVVRMLKSLESKTGGTGYRNALMELYKALISHFYHNVLFSNESDYIVLNILFFLHPCIDTPPSHNDGLKRLFINFKS